MYTKEQICSAACLRLGCSEIVGFNEGTTEAKVCASVYPLVLENLLSYRWNFPKTAVSLARLTETPLRGYKYFYALPTDCLVVVSLGSGRREHKKSELYALFEGKIATDVEQPVLTYVKKDDEKNFPAFFTAGLTDGMTAEIAMTLTGNIDVASFWTSRAEKTIKKARSLDAQQTPPDTIEDLTLVNARG